MYVTFNITFDIEHLEKKKTFPKAGPKPATFGLPGKRSKRDIGKSKPRSISLPIEAVFSLNLRMPHL